MQGTNGVSKARLRKYVRDSRPAAPTAAITVTPASGGSTASGATARVFGMNITPSTTMVAIVDDAGVGVTATVTAVTVVPSTATTLGSVTPTIVFVSLPATTPNLFRLYLTSPYGQRVFAGTVSSGA